MKTGTCAYIDILGFKNFVQENSEGALKLLQNYQMQLNFFIEESKGGEYLTPYKGDSFKYLILIPFSDCIFFYSDNPSAFALQLANFINGSFSFTSNTFVSPEDESYPENVTERGVEIVDGKPVIRSYPSKWYPLLFRGGIGHGDAKVFELYGIQNGAMTKTPFVFGNSVIEAVQMETIEQKNGIKVKGPRILCTKEYYNKLDTRAKKIVHPAFDFQGYYELNWTAIHYVMTDNLNYWFVEQLLNNDFNNIFCPAASLYRAYRNNSISEPHYRNFLKLIVRGLYHYLEETEYWQIAEKHIITKINEEELSNIQTFLFDWS